MTPTEIHSALGDLPHMTLAQGRAITAFVRERGARDVLELGFYHGVSTAYLAAAVEPLDGRVVTIDAEYARSLSPGIDEVLARTGLAPRVTRYFEPRSYTWRLRAMLREDPTPRFDFCYLDGAHTWDDDGFAFFLVERLLRPGGWILFDDLDWSFEQSPTLRETERVRAMPEEYRAAAQVRDVYELLVKPHPAFDEFREEGPWAFARKSPSAGAAGALPAVKREYVAHASVRALARAVANRAVERARAALTGPRRTR